MPKVLSSMAASLVAIGALTIGASIPAFAYVSQGTSGATVSPSSCSPGGTSTFTATFKDANSAGIAGASVTFSQQSGPANSQVTFSSTTGTTDANGVASTTVTLPTVCAGNFVLAASTQGVTVTASITGSGGFPATSADLPSNGTAAWALVLAVLGAVLIVVSSLGLIRRFS